MADYSVNQNFPLDGVFISGLLLEQMPEIQQKVINRYWIDYDMRIFDFMTKRPYVVSKQLTYTHKERGRHQRKLFIQGSGTVQNVSITPASGGSPVTVSAAVFTVSPNSMSINPTRPTVYMSPVQVNDLIEFPNGNLQGIVVSVNTATNPHTFALVPQATGVTPADLVGAVAANGQLVNFGNTRGEGHNTGKGVLPEGKIYENEIHFMEHGFPYTDISTGTKSWFDYYNPQTGKRGDAYFIEAEYQQWVRFKRKQAYNLFFAQRNTAGIIDYTTTIPDAKYQSTDGLFTIARRYGLVNYPAGNLTMTYFDQLINELNRRVNPKANLVLHGLQWMSQAKNFLVDYFKNGAISYGTFNYGQAKKMDLNFQSIHMNGYDFVFRPMDMFNDEQMFGDSAFKYIRSALIAPMDESLQTIDGGTDQSMMNSITIRYMDLRNFYDSTFTKLGGTFAKNGTEVSWTSGNPSDDTTIRKMNYAAKLGVQVFGQDRFILSEPA